MSVSPPFVGPLKLTVTQERWPFAAPFRTSGRTSQESRTITVTLESAGQVGRGEASGVYYKGDTVENMLQQLESVRPAIESGLSRASAQRLLPAAGARNALDCALWDLEAKLTGKAAWQIAGLAPPRALLTTFTCGAEAPDAMAKAALGFHEARAIKLKLIGEPLDAARVRAVRDACPNVWLSVDANQGFSLRTLDALLPVLSEARVQMIEQPFAVGQEAQLDELESPIPIAADESLQGIADLPALMGRFEVVNIKLDKCGGLSEGLAIAQEAKRRGFKVMVGNMAGTSLAMAPSYLVGQLCDLVDLDGPALLKLDRATPVRYVDGKISCPEELWGGRASQ
jgi:L-alanine-DL-glutamate epimerase-like enolase superfamily enzyme